MKVKVEIKAGRDWVKRGMLTTMGINPLNDFEKYHKAMHVQLTDATFESLLIGRHSPCDEFEIWVDAIVPERVHTHVVRHKELGKYVATSRPDIWYNIELNPYIPVRLLSLCIPAKRMIEICWDRLCFKAWKETIQLFEEIKKELCLIEPVFKPFLEPSCVWFGFCPQTSPGNACKYAISQKGIEARKNLIEKGRL